MFSVLSVLSKVKYCHSVVYEGTMTIIKTLLILTLLITLINAIIHVSDLFVVTSKVIHK